VICNINFLADIDNSMAVDFCSLNHPRTAI
jgi:hypothetical protein